ncbi:MAG: rod shape-determining protein MreC [Smithella sp.]|mgnify:FL=1|jgi:rod shape-determining protein MreC|nr:rod shape-determining protein MreC [Smithella sp.]
MFFKNYRTVIFICAAVVAALILLSYSLKYASGTGMVKKLVLEAAASVQIFFNIPVERTKSAWTRYIHLVGLEEDNRKLRQTVAELQAQLILYQEGRLEADRLRQLLSLQQEYQHSFLAARVIGKEQGAFSRSLWINKGSAHGLKPGMPVMVSQGVIGRITDISWHNSKVMLLIDQSSNVDALIQRTRAQGIVRGAGTRDCVMRYVSKTQDVREGDLVLTSGLSNIFPRGLLIGRVSNVGRTDFGLFLQINVVPFADFASIEEVMVVTGVPVQDLAGEKTVK